MTTRRELLKTTVPFALAGGALGSLFTATAAAQQNQQQGGNQSKMMKSLESVWDGQQYTLPELPYAYNALEPHIDEQTMRLHHDKHHQGYVDGLNKAMKALNEAGSGEVDSAKLYGLQRDLSFNYGGHLLHTLFWATMGPNAGGQPEGELKTAIDQSFGGFDAFKSLLTNSGKTVKGSGWTMLVWEPFADKLYVKAINEHDTHFGPGQCPLLPLDIWEHAFYLKYQNNKAAYMDAWFNVIDWTAAGELYTLYRTMMKGDSAQGQ